MPLACHASILNIFVSSSSIIMVASAVTLVLITGNLNLSVGGVGAMSAVLFSLMTRNGMDISLALLLAVLSGGFAGFLCVYSIAAMLLPSFIISLAFKYICRGVALIGANGAVVFGLPYEVSQIGGTVAGFPLPMVYALAIVAIFMFIQSRTVFGSKCHAVGSNINAAKLSGIPLALPIVIAVVLLFLFVEKRTIVGKYAIAIGGNDKATYYSGINVVKMRMVFFTLCGGMAALAGMWQVARLGSCDPTIGTGMEFNVVAACILGGVNIKGGEGTVIGVLIGTVILAILTNGMQMMGMDSFYQQVATGIVLFGAVVLNSMFGGGVSLKRKGRTLAATQRQ